ncbi:nuclear transport factor 2 family protein [Leucobacter sp. CSA2]|uniref:Nuclear transport factor 2 family protein n=1 Tax=Leucobacter edaphi TaxID=2796472 RepID=A0A934Q9B3_9MICO|nr:nuclear transport factor 2 family protein [Leucobacter edaphi]MBK0420569.1 nuclear transport factor 2 family protein [Leucobacter edaphi]
MNAGAALRGLMVAIDERRWDELQRYLHPEFLCHFVHTGESFTRAEWIQFNAGYPDFDRLEIQELVAAESEAVCRSHVTCRSESGLLHFACASFARMADGQIVQLTEVWADIGQQAPPETRASVANPA